jgi:hypothetical protein
MAQGKLLIFGDLIINTNRFQAKKSSHDSLNG